MTLSRTSRILLSTLLLVVAAFLWVNFFVRDSGFNFTILSAAPAPSPEGAESAGAPQTPTVAPVPELGVARDLEVLDLPFLVTEPPAPTETEPDAAESTTPEAPNQAARRATVNPFAPIVERAAARAGAPATPAQQQQQQQRMITEVPVPTAPPRTTTPTPIQAEAPKAPAPAPVTPGARATGTLPRALPGGTLGGTPQLLRSAIGATEVPARDLSQVAAIREPEESRPQLQELGEAAAERSEPEPLSQPIDPEIVADDRPSVPMPGDAPLAAGTSPLSRHLRDNNVRFTGSVIGPVSVGVFRSTVTSAPIVISLGQTLPDTSIVLTDLRGQQAELMLGDATQTLTLELRR
ncbi:MAG: hypothetical protein WD273_04045 [Trueperaceae bacterium]